MGDNLNKHILCIVYKAGSADLSPDLVNQEIKPNLVNQEIKLRAG